MQSSSVLRELLLASEQNRQLHQQQETLNRRSTQVNQHSLPLPVPIETSDAKSIIQSERGLCDSSNMDYVNQVEQRVSTEFCSCKNDQLKI